MSNFVLPKSSPNRFQGLSQKLLSPTGIAVFASIGIHAALGASLPYFSSTSKEKAPPRTVQLVQLSPAEQSRLPQLSPSPLPLNQLQALPGLSTPYPPLSSFGLPSNLSPVNPPTNGLLSKTPQTTVLKPSTTTNNTKPQTSNDKKVTERKLAPYQGGVKIEASNQREKFSSGGRLPNLNLTAADYAPLVPPPPPPSIYPAAPTGNQTVSQQVAPPSQSSSLPQFSNQQARGTNSRTPTPLVSPNIPGLPETNNPTSTTQSPSQELVGIKPATGAPQLPTAPPLKPNEAEGGKGTTNDDYQRRSIEALASMGNIGGLEKYATISGNQATACMERMSGTTIITAQVDPQGTVGSTAVTVPSKSQAFNTAAEIAVSGINFGAKGKQMAYQVPVEFKYDPGACGSAATPKETAQPQTSTPKTPEAANTSTPITTPAPKK